MDVNNSVVYFASVKDEGGFRIKIGKASNWGKRYKEHQSTQLGHKVAFTTLCVVKGNGGDESVIHDYFREYRLPGEIEVYRPVEPILEYIRWLRDQYFVWIQDDDECQPLNDLPRVDSSLWVPDEHKRVKSTKASFLDWPASDPLGMGERKTGGDDFYTSEVVINAVREVYGGVIDLDPASHAIANKVVRATEFFTLATDGLSKEWKGNVWLNPPFSEWSRWVNKFFRELGKGGVKQACIYAASRTITAQFFAPIVSEADSICIIHGRIPCWGARSSTPTDGHVVFYFGKNKEVFREAFAGIGTTYFS